VTGRYSLLASVDRVSPTNSERQATQARHASSLASSSRTIVQRKDITSSRLLPITTRATFWGCTRAPCQHSTLSPRRRSSAGRACYPLPSMSARLNICPPRNRHVRADESRCQFCCTELSVDFVPCPVAQPVPPGLSRFDRSFGLRDGIRAAGAVRAAVAAASCYARRIASRPPLSRPSHPLVSPASTYSPGEIRRSVNVESLL